MKLPDRHSVFWKLSVLLVAFCLLMIWLSWYWGRYVQEQNAFLADDARDALRQYAAAAEEAHVQGQRAGVDAWLEEVSARESGFVAVIGPDFTSLSSRPLDAGQLQRLTFLRSLDMPMSRRARSAPWLQVPFVNHPEQGSLVLALPERFAPGRYAWFWTLLTNAVMPGFFTLLLCVGLYRMLVVPLNQLREQANAWRVDQLNARLCASTTGRADELGELGRAFDHMAERLQSTVALQQQLLRDLSHELRTPLSRLRVACDGENDERRLRERLDREIDGMQRLVEDTLQLAWLDAERSPLASEAIQIQALWDMLAENACFESQWPAAQLLCEVDPHCWVQGNLNSLAQALENLLRNAIRHSPATGCITLRGARDGAAWLLWLEDEGGGVAEADLQRIFDPFTRLDGSRPGDGGFGLGLSIARNALTRQGGALWAENTARGLRLCMRLPAAYAFAL